MTKSNNLERLVGLATETSSERRRDLLREMSDLFLSSPESYNAQENSHFGEIMGTIAFDLEQEIREELAQKLAAVSAAPEELIRKLANDEISVARSVLEQSSVLNESDLINLAEKHGQEHMLAITKRDDITKAVSNVLVKRGDDRVVGGLIENNKAEISDLDMKSVLDRAQNNEGLQASLTHRRDLPKDLILDFVQHVSSELRQKILVQANGITPNELDQALKGVEKKYAKHAENQARGISKIETLIAKLAADNQLDERMLVKFARSQKSAEFICGLAHLANIDITTTKHVVFNKSHEGLAVICRALNFDRSTFSNFVLAIASNKTRAIDDSYTMLDSYDKLTPDTAQRILRFWRVRKNATKGEKPSEKPILKSQSA